ncbi:hypothetical protein N7448_009719 [Penicillium atrosanguineum]|uniref:F-box domain-containing protein n=1 Tax=Penicillium atrosanguineum TaxID=1132637 RepID=A0A9W9GLH4_9EURO|nr:hypothetical protein N7448_009719 [Penicillium atrosanguineum]KAJ5320888.1 hypothetical protein N7476_003890 [Penicillium atrosanguineum]
MAEAGTDWADRPRSDLASSSDEEGFVSSHSTASVEPDAIAQHHLSTAIGNLHLQQAASSRSSDEHNPTRTSTPGTAASMEIPSDTEAGRKPMQLLKLPLDVLKDIVKEITHTNDLTSLALTCSALHALTIPHMYSRFDIVWPESLNPTAEDYSGVDALSYGLSTLVMGDDVFDRPAPPRYDKPACACSNCGCDDYRHQSSQTRGSEFGFRPRRGNYYAQYTRTFSIGNGPLSWVQEYSVNREVGKMLGTLVALAVARMVNLEAFVWDMPTGVVREIWLALASLADRPGHSCRLERIWVRWHDNSENVLRISNVTPESRPLQRYRHVEHPSLSVLPPLKSVAVLDIDEPAYVEELGLLIERSRRRLVELRIGISMKAHLAPWVTCKKETDTLWEPLMGWPKAGGILSVLSKRESETQTDENAIASSDAGLAPSESSASISQDRSKNKTSTQTTSVLADQSQPNGVSHSGRRYSTPRLPDFFARPSDEQLNLEVLELERVPLSIPTLLPTLDWTRLITLTLMRCEDHENLWRALRRKYAPPALPPKRPQNTNQRRSSYDAPSAPEYSLKLKHLRTDTVSSYLMLFIKDTLAPNTLESVYLNEGAGYESSVHIDAIYRHILRKHRLSLRKVSIDASERFGISDNRHGNVDAMSHRWHKWMFNHEMISFVTSERMPQLRELGMAMHYRDWHFFLQRLPHMPQLRALYLLNISNSLHRDLKELALQVLDIVSIRPELKITYIGLETKCYQILEATSTGDFENPQANDTSTGDDGFHFDPAALTDDDDDEPGQQDPELMSSDPSEDDYDADLDESIFCVRFTLQEILFYDDKISIFKARHGVI